MKITDTFKSRFGRIEICRGTNGQFYARVIARNGNELIRTSELYKRRNPAVQALRTALNILYHIKF